MLRKNLETAGRLLTRAASSPPKLCIYIYKQNQQTNPIPLRKEVLELHVYLYIYIYIGFIFKKKPTNLVFWPCVSFVPNFFGKEIPLGWNNSRNMALPLQNGYFPTHFIENRKVVQIQDDLQSWMN